MKIVKIGCFLQRLSPNCPQKFIIKNGGFKMEINKNELQNLLDDWMNYREEELSTLTEKDKKHLPGFEDRMEIVLQYVHSNNKKCVNELLEDMYNDLMDYSWYWDRKYYKSGFSDGIKLILSVLI